MCSLALTSCTPEALWGNDPLELTDKESTTSSTEAEQAERILGAGQSPPWWWGLPCHCYIRFDGTENFGGSSDWKLTAENTSAFFRGTSSSLLNPTVESYPSSFYPIGASGIHDFTLDVSSGLSSTFMLHATVTCNKGSNGTDITTGGGPYTQNITFTRGNAELFMPPNIGFYEYFFGCEPPDNTPPGS